MIEHLCQRWRRRGGVAAACFALALAASACLDELGPPNGTGTDTCNNNGICELEQRESCQSCPADCSCCNAIFANGMDGTRLSDVEGPANGKTITIDFSKLAVVELALGVPLLDALNSDDLQIVGEVTSDPQGEDGTGCTHASTGGGILVQAEMLTGQGSQREYRTFGHWTKTLGKDPTFDLRCSSLSSSASRIRLVAQPGAVATLDAIEALSCFE